MLRVRVAIQNRNPHEGTKHRLYLLMNLQLGPHQVPASLMTSPNLAALVIRRCRITLHLHEVTTSALIL